MKNYATFVKYLNILHVGKSKSNQPARRSVFKSNHADFRRSGIFLSLILFVFSGFTVYAQTHKIAQDIEDKSHLFEKLDPVTLLELNNARNIVSMDLTEALNEASFYNFNQNALNKVRQESPQELLVNLSVSASEVLTLKLTRAEIFSESFQVYTATDRVNPYPFERGLYYWGTVENEDESLVAIAITTDEMMGFISIGAEKYTLGKMANRTDGLHVLYKDNDLLYDPGLSCHVDEKEHTIGTSFEESDRQSSDKCVLMYVEVDYDIVVGKGGVQQAADYVTGAFSQVLILYANDNIEMLLNELVVWNVADPYTGPSTSNYLTQFRNYLNGNYNGDLAHLVGYNGGGGIAYLDVLCNSYYGVGYSAVNSTYQNVPTYSWTIMVLAHEIGHNLGSEHTHACKWNGNNTAIDGCGAVAGYSEGCTGPIPTEGGTIMSYCHLNSVGINLNLGFGPQPGDRMRGKIFNANCLESCGPPIENDAGIVTVLSPVGFPCENNLNPVVRLQNFGNTTLTSVTINYQLDNGAVNTHNWTGSLAKNATTDVTLPNISYSPGTHTFQAYTSAPNGVADENPDNDGTNSSFEFFENYCVCNPATAQISPNPLTNSGSGSSNATLSLDAGSKNASFSITGLGSQQSGNPRTRYVDQVVVTYTNHNGTSFNYGTFQGSQQSSVSVNIDGFVNSITISLSNSLGGSYNGTQSVSFSTVNYCSGDPDDDCPDADGDGVCDDDDICPDFDDNLIGQPCDDGDPCTENAVYTTDCICVGTAIPGCGGGCPNTSSASFSPNPLSNQGSGSSNSNVSLPAGSSDVSFTVSNLGARINGNPNQRYIDVVNIHYVDGAGNTVHYGTFDGTQQSSVTVEIAGAVQSISVALSNGQGTNVSQSVSLSSVTFCASQALAGMATDPFAETNAVELYPNPASNELFVRFADPVEFAEITIYNILGVQLNSYSLTETQFHRIDLAAAQISNQILILEIKQEGLDPVIRKVMVR